MAEFNDKLRRPLCQGLDLVIHDHQQVGSVHLTQSSEETTVLSLYLDFWGEGDEAPPGEAFDVEIDFSASTNLRLYQQVENKNDSTEIGGAGGGGGGDRGERRPDLTITTHVEQGHCFKIGYMTTATSNLLIHAGGAASASTAASMSRMTMDGENDELLDEQPFRMQFKAKLKLSEPLYDYRDDMTAAAESKIADGDDGAGSGGSDNGAVRCREVSNTGNNSNGNKDGGETGSSSSSSAAIGKNGRIVIKCNLCHQPLCELGENDVKGWDRLLHPKQPSGIQEITSSEMSKWKHDASTTSATEGVEKDGSVVDITKSSIFYYENDLDIMVYGRYRLHRVCYNDALKCHVCNGILTGEHYITEPNEGRRKKGRRRGGISDHDSGEYSSGGTGEHDEYGDQDGFEDSEGQGQQNARRRKSQAAGSVGASGGGGGVDGSEDGGIGGSMLPGSEQHRRRSTMRRKGSMFGRRASLNEEEDEDEVGLGPEGADEAELSEELQLVHDVGDDVDVGLLDETNSAAAHSARRNALKTIMSPVPDVYRVAEDWLYTAVGHEQVKGMLSHSEQRNLVNVDEFSDDEDEGEARMTEAGNDVEDGEEGNDEVLLICADHAKLTVASVIHDLSGHWDMIAQIQEQMNDPDADQPIDPLDPFGEDESPNEQRQKFLDREKNNLANAKLEWAARLKRAAAVIRKHNARWVKTNKRRKVLPILPSLYVDNIAPAPSSSAEGGGSQGPMSGRAPDDATIDTIVSVFKKSLDSLITELVAEPDKTPGTAPLLAALINYLLATPLGRPFFDRNGATGQLSHELLETALNNGSLDILQVLLQILELDFDPIEILSLSFFNKKIRIPSTFLVLNRLWRDRHVSPNGEGEWDRRRFGDSVTDEVQHVWQTFFTDVASSMREIAGESRANRLPLLRKMLSVCRRDASGPRVDAVNQLGPDGYNIFARACHEGDVILVRLLLKFKRYVLGRDPSFMSRKAAHDMIAQMVSAPLPDSGITPLMAAVMGNSNTVVRILLDIPAVVKTVKHSTPQHGTVVELAKLLNRDEAMLHALSTANERMANPLDELTNIIEDQADLIYGGLEHSGKRKGKKKKQKKMGRKKRADEPDSPSSRAGYTECPAGLMIHKSCALDFKKGKRVICGGCHMPIFESEWYSTYDAVPYHQECVGIFSRTS